MSTTSTRAELKESLQSVEYQLALINSHERDKDRMILRRREQIQKLEEEIANIEYEVSTGPDRRLRLLATRQTILTQLATLDIPKPSTATPTRQVAKLFENILNGVLARGSATPREQAFLRSYVDGADCTKLWNTYKELA